MISDSLFEEMFSKYEIGISIQSLSKEYHKKPSTISKCFKAHGIVISKGLRKRYFSPQQVNEIISLYRGHYGVNEIARKFNCDTALINRVLKENNVEKVAWRKVNKNLKDDFFEVIDTEEKAYLLGLMTTDGYVKVYSNRNSNTIGISLQLGDIELIEWIKQTLCIDGKIQYDKRPNKECCTIEWSSQKMVKDLSQYGVIPNKTYLLTKLTKKIPSELYHHYLRGLYDGDGICHIVDDKFYDPNVGFCGYSEDFVRDFQYAVDRIINKKQHNQIRKQNAYQCSWRGRQQVLKILNALYKDSTCCLKRKHDKYIKLKDSVKT